jgi:hypothetical protein
MDSYTTIGQRIRDNIRKAQAAGIKLTKGEWGIEPDGDGDTYVTEGPACALACTMLVEDVIPTDDEHHEEDAARALGVDRHWVDSFIRGFDGDNPSLPYDSRYKHDSGAYELGQQIAREFFPH